MSPSVDDSSLEEYEANVPRTVVTYTLQDLEAGSVYKVQVTAVSVVDGKEWSSPPLTRFIKTVALPSKEYPQSGELCTRDDSRLTYHKICLPESMQMRL